MSNNGLISGSFSSDTTLSVPVAINKGGTGQTTAQAALDALAAASGTLVQGDIFIVDSSGNVVALARGSDNQTLLMNGNNPNWETVAAGGATVEAVQDTLDATATTTSGTLEVMDTGFTIDVPTITDGKATVSLTCTTRNGSSALSTTALYDVTNGAALSILSTDTNQYNQTHTVTTDTDGDTMRGYFASLAGGTTSVFVVAGENTATICALGVG